MYSSSAKLVIALAGLVGLAGGVAAGKRRSRTRLRIGSARPAEKPGKSQGLGREVLLNVAGQFIFAAISFVAVTVFGLIREHGVVAFFGAMAGVTLVGMIIGELVLTRARRDGRPSKTIDTMEITQFVFAMVWFVSLIAFAMVP